MKSTRIVKPRGQEMILKLFPFVLQYFLLLMDMPSIIPIELLLLFYISYCQQQAINNNEQNLEIHGHRI
jgi:hypothetical protein